MAVDREDRREAARQRRADEEAGKPSAPFFDKYQLKKEVAKREAAKETTPATQADLGKLGGAISHMKALLRAGTGKTPLMDRPPSLQQWRIEGEMEGHSVAETLRYLSDCADWADELDEQRSRGFVLSPLAEPQWVTKMRRWFHR